MKRTLLSHVAAAVLGLLLAAGGRALADKTIVYLSTGTAVTSLHFELLAQPGKVVAEVCARSPLQGGGFGEARCRPTVLTSGAIFDAVNTLATGGALTFYKAQEGL